MFIILISSSHNIGGEEKADYPPEVRDGEVVGPGLAFNQALVMKQRLSLQLSAETHISTRT
ncbi:MAG: glycine/sarcosine/betaine reductase selenoprotein B family protein [Lachnoclostridium sp.]